MRTTNQQKDLERELAEAMERLRLIQPNYYSGYASRQDFTEAIFKVNTLRNQLGIQTEVPMLSTAIGRPRWVSQPKFEE